MQLKLAFIFVGLCQKLNGFSDVVEIFCEADNILVCVAQHFDIACCKFL